MSVREVSALKLEKPHQGVRTIENTKTLWGKEGERWDAAFGKARSFPASRKFCSSKLEVLEKISRTPSAAVLLYEKDFSEEE